MQGISWKGSYYIFPYERDTASEQSPDYREVMLCQMSDRMEALEEALEEITNADGTSQMPKHVSRSAIIQIAKNALTGVGITATALNRRLLGGFQRPG